MSINREYAEKWFPDFVKRVEAELREAKFRAEIAIGKRREGRYHNPFPLANTTYLDRWCDKCGAERGRYNAMYMTPDGKMCLRCIRWIYGEKRQLPQFLQEKGATVNRQES